ncbi:hypothetical protein BKA67DRAFT_583028 [Truncatella angustata]|uniref:J domain-containing protein n=1 Tax=Truncatella angustata TaxID=152316 RepID=A0A9P8RL23_9PEZI|nr:uncharacterized protein BKA67DRAFT_583028 [Truncatella angustata]KAH6646036.1 hypothetical protein BKA67DRAFT_583028 [Truncatella angustata]
MSPAPSFNYYEELEVSPTATQQDVVFSYRKLAKVHHPDRNHGDASTATAKFQRVSAPVYLFSSMSPILISISARRGIRDTLQARQARTI